MSQKFKNLVEKIQELTIDNDSVVESAPIMKNSFGGNIVMPSHSDVEKYINASKKAEDFVQIGESYKVLDKT